MIFRVVRTAAAETRHRRLDSEFYASPLQTVIAAIAESKLDWRPLPSVSLKLNSGGTPRNHNLTTGSVPFITIECIDPLWLDLTRGKRVEVEHRDGSLKRAVLSPGDVVITIKRRIANAAVVGDDGAGSVVNQDVAVLRPNGDIEPEVIATCLVSRIGKSQAQLMQTEQINPYISLTSLRHVRVPIFAQGFRKSVCELVHERTRLLQQAEEHVVQAMETVSEFLGLDSTGSSASTVLTSSNMREQKRLDAEYYCRPRLTFRSGIDTVAIGSSSMTILLNNGSTPAAGEYSDEGTPIFKVGGLSRFSSADWLGDRVDDNSAAAKGTRGEVKVGDVLILAAAHDVRYIGKTGLLQELPEGEKARVVGELIRVRPCGIDGATLTAYLNLPAVRLEVQRLVRGQSAHLYPGDLKDLPVPVIPDRIQDRVHSLFEASQKDRAESGRILDSAIAAVEAEAGIQASG